MVRRLDLAHSLPMLKIASPCHMSWDDLTPVAGEANRRSCEECGLHVHNFGAMTPDEIERVMTSSNGRVCASAYVRTDGTVILRDCPVGLRAVRQKVLRGVARVAAVVAFAATGTFLWASGRKDAWQETRLRTLEPFATIAAKLDPSVVAPPRGLRMAGEVCPVSPPTPAATSPGAPGGS